MVYEVRKQWMAWMKHGLQISLNRRFRRKIKWWLELLGALRILGKMAPSEEQPRFSDHLYSTTNSLVSAKTPRKKRQIDHTSAAQEKETAL